MNFRYFLMFLPLLASCVFGQKAVWENDGSVMYDGAPVDQRFFIPILSDKRSINQKIRSLKERGSNDRFKNILFG